MLTHLGLVPVSLTFVVALATSCSKPEERTPSPDPAVTAPVASGSVKDAEAVGAIASDDSGAAVASNQTDGSTTPDGPPKAQGSHGSGTGGGRGAGGHRSGTGKHGSGGGGGGGGGTGADKPSSEKPTNLKVLSKKWTRERVEKEMKSYRKALGVKCKYCHDVSDYAADKNAKKAIARDMISMTAAMNRQYFKGAKTKLSCATCHKGKAEL